MRPRKFQVPKPSRGMRAPFASSAGVTARSSAIGTNSMEAGVEALADEAIERSALCPRKHCECHVRSLLDDLEQCACRPPRGTLALLPVADGLDWNPDTGGELRLRQV